MSLRRLRRVIFLLMAFSVLSLPAADIVAAHPRSLQSDDRDSTQDSAVVGNSYTSPHFGFSVTWDRTWTVSEEQNETDSDLLTLTNDSATVSFNGVYDAVDVADCVEIFSETIAAGDGISDFEQLELDEGPAGADSDNWAISTFTYTSPNGQSIDFALYVDCRSIVEGESLLVIYSFIPADMLESQLEPLSELLQGVSVDGSTGSTSDDQGDTDTDRQSSDIAGFVTVSARDIDDFWSRAFPLISNGDTYTPPTDVVPFDQPTDSGCGRVAPMEVGPFYCPPDRTVYYDLEYAQMQVDTFATNAVVAVAMAHEVGHHVQNLMEWKECQKTPCLDPSEMTSQEFELQADCFAGAWLADAETRGRLGTFDIEANIAQFALMLGDRGIGNTADPGAHGKAARRTFQFLNGYYNGVMECLKISAASDPARNGGANASTNTKTDADKPTPTPNADEPTPEVDEPTPTRDAGNDDLLQIGDTYDIKLRSATLTMTVTGTQVLDDLGGRFQADGTYLIVTFTVERDAKRAAPFPYASFVVTDSDGNEYEFDEAATDAVLKTADTLPDGVEQDLEPGLRYRLAIIFDVPADASGFVFSTSAGDFPVELDV